MDERYTIPYTNSGYLQDKSGQIIKLDHPNIIAYRYWTAADVMDQLEEYWNDDVPFDQDIFEQEPILQRLFLDQMQYTLDDYEDLNCDAILEAAEHAMKCMVAEDRTGIPTLNRAEYVACQNKADIQSIDHWLELQIGTEYDSALDKNHDCTSKVLYEINNCDNYLTRPLYIGEITELLAKYVNPYHMTHIYPLRKLIDSYGEIHLFHSGRIWD